MSFAVYSLCIFGLKSCGLSWGLQYVYNSQKTMSISISKWPRTWHQTHINNTFIPQIPNLRYSHLYLLKKTPNPRQSFPVLVTHCHWHQLKHRLTLDRFLHQLLSLMNPIYAIFYPQTSKLFTSCSTLCVLYCHSSTHFVKADVSSFWVDVTFQTYTFQITITQSSPLSLQFSSSLSGRQQDIWWASTRTGSFEQQYLNYT